MKKNIRFIIVTAVIIVVLAVAAVIILNIPENNDSGTKTTSADILLYDKTHLDPEEITVKNSSGEYTLIGFSYSAQASEAAAAESSDTSEVSYNLRTEDGITPADMKMHYTMQDYENETLSKDKMDVLAYQCSYVTAFKLVDKSGSKYKDYGLDNPAATVEIIFSDNSEEKLYIGNEAPDNQGVYIRREGNANVYLANSASIDAFLVDKLQLFDMTLTPELDSESDIVSLSVTGEALDVPVEISSEVEKSSVSHYKMTSPAREVCSTEMVQVIASSVYGVTGTYVSAAQATEEDLKKFGLDKPYIDITARASDQSSASLLISKADENGNCYIMKKGGSLICRMSKTDASKWYDIQSYVFYSSKLISPNFQELSEAEITTGGKSYRFIVKNEKSLNDMFEEIIKTTVSLDGDDVNVANINTYISNMSNIARGEMTDSIDGYEEVYKAVLKFGDDEALTDIIKIYRNDKNSYILSLNGNIECYGDAEYLQKFIAQTEKIATDEKVEIISTDADEDSSDSSETSDRSVSSDISQAESRE